MIDLSKLIDIGSSMHSNITGYAGTDTMPTCTNKICWYLYEAPYALTQANLDFFTNQDPTVKSNNRVGDQGDPTKYRFTYQYKGFFVDKS